MKNVRNSRKKRQKSQIFIQNVQEQSKVKMFVNETHTNCEWNWIPVSWKETFILFYQKSGPLMSKQADLKLITVR